MSTATAPAFGAAKRPLVTPQGWFWIAVLGALFVLVFGSYLEFLFRRVTNASGDNFFELLLSGAGASWNPDWSHALVVPLISLYYLFQHRDRLAATKPRLFLPALPIVFVGLFSYGFWIFPGRNDMFQGYSMILTLVGLALFALGPAMMRILWFPILYLVFAIKVADRVWSAIAFELQQIAAAGATIALKFATLVFEFEVNNRGSNIELTFVQNGVLTTESLNVAEACAGLRMLMAFLALGVALAFLFDRAWWQRLVMVLMAVPIAIAVNVGRVTVLGLLYLVDKDLAKGDFHTFVGILMLLPAAGLFLLLGWILDKIILPADGDDADDARAAGRPAPALTEPEPYAPLAPRSIARGLALGVLLTLLIGATYALFIATIRPDLLLEDVPWGVVAAGLAVAGVAVLGSAVALPRLMRSPTPALRRTVALSLAAGVLLTTWGGQQYVIATTRAVLIKQAVPLQQPLVTLPSKSGNWVLVEEDPPLPAEILEALGTNQYISRVYRDSAWPTDRPGGHIRLHVAYYTGTMDTVPHVPERCFVAGGAEGIDQGLTQLTLSGDYEADPQHGGYLHPVTPHRPTLITPMARVPSTELDASYFTFAEPRSGQVHNVLYFFAANGKYLPTPDFVRFQGFDPRDKYSYYCKIEVQVFGIPEREAAAERASAFLSTMLPEVMACLPDWVEVTQGRWPVEKASGEKPVNQ